MKKRDEKVYLVDVLNNIELIEKFVGSKNKIQLSKDIKTIYSILRALEIIGEATKNLSQSIKNKYPEIPWKEIAGTRDKLIHHYFGIDTDIIWDIVKKDLPDLKEKIKKILREVET
jgi:uncharacterized protein with HEPN domain